VKYTDETNKKPIEEELRNIIISVEDKYPALKAVLNNSEYEVSENTINFNFKTAISGFLKAMNYDKKIHEAKKTCMAQPIK
jgi:DNA polymerase-3 subunit alpha (Gram-positive type)